MRTYTPEFIYQMANMLNIGIALSAEKNHTRLLEMILTEARKVTSADAGTLFMCEDDQLVFKIIHNETLKIFSGGNGEPINLPPAAMDLSTVAAYTAITKKSVNIPDVDADHGFDFSGPKRYEALTGYKSVSMLVVPLENREGKVIGVLQLINAKDGKGNIIPFAPYLEKVVFSLASQAAVSLSNMHYIEEIERLLRSFVEVMATTIDARSPYNANHTRRVARMTEELAKVITAADEFAEEVFDEERREQLVMAAWLHDIGKIATPSRVMDKATRLEGRIEVVLQRFDYIAAWLKLVTLEQNLAMAEVSATAEVSDRYWEDGRFMPNDMVNGTGVVPFPVNELVSGAFSKDMLAQVEWARKLILYANDPVNSLSTEIIQELAALGQRSYVDWQGVTRPWLTQEEIKALSVRYGTLTSEERQIMEDHVDLTRRILEVIPFPEKLSNVPYWASLHHEYLDGSGYPLKLIRDQIPLEGRILTLIDIFDALTASDRPYKKAMSVDEALGILEGLVDKGKIDAKLFYIFKQHRIWECFNEERGQEV